MGVLRVDVFNAGSIRIIFNFGHEMHQHYSYENAKLHFCGYCSSQISDLDASQPLGSQASKNIKLNVIKKKGGGAHLDVGRRCGVFFSHRADREVLSLR